MVYNVVLPLCIQTMTLEPLCFVGNVPYSLAILGEVGELREGTPRKGQKPGIWGKHMQSFGGGRDRTSHFREIFQNVRNVLKCTENKHKQQKQKEETMNTKRLLGILLAMLLTVSAMFALAACNTNNDNNNSKSEVKLLGITGNNSIQTETKATANNSKLFASLSAPIYADAETKQPGETTGTAEQPDDQLDVYSTYTIIYKTQTTLYFTINLSNPKNYYILDFRLTCAEEDVTVKQGNHYSNINNENTYIRWDEAVDRIGNHTATFELHLPDADITSDNIKISEMYYSDRTDGTNKTSVNMNNKETYTVYKIDEPVVMTDRKNNFDEFSFKLAAIEGAVVKSVKVDGVAYDADAEGVYHIPGGELVVEYEYKVKDGIKYEKKIEEKIELLKFVKEYPEKETNAYFRLKKDNMLIIEGVFIGTDSDKIAVNGDFLRDTPFINYEEQICIYFSEYIDYDQINVIITVAGTEFNLRTDFTYRF